jgi:transposase-like protein
VGQEVFVAKRPHHSEEFKREAVRLLKESGKSLHEQARELGIHYSTLWDWREKFNHENNPVTEESLEGRVLTKDEEIRRLRKELVTVREERDFLKKAAAFFAKESR